MEEFRTNLEPAANEDEEELDDEEEGLEEYPFLDDGGFVFPVRLMDLANEAGEAITVPDKDENAPFDSFGFVIVVVNVSGLPLLLLKEEEKEVVDGREVLLLVVFALLPPNKAPKLDVRREEAEVDDALLGLVVLPLVNTEKAFFIR